MQIVLSYNFVSKMSFCRSVRESLKAALLRSQSNLGAHAAVTPNLGASASFSLGRSPNAFSYISQFESAEHHFASAQFISLRGFASGPGSTAGRQQDARRRAVDQGLYLVRYSTAPQYVRLRLLLRYCVLE